MRLRSGTMVQLCNGDIQIKNDWNDLVPLEDLKGKDGKPPEFEVRDGHLIAIYL